MSPRTTTNQPVAADVMPDPDDDAVIEQPLALEQQADEEADVEEPVSKRPPVVEDDRDRIAQLYREKRERERQAEETQIGLKDESVESDSQEEKPEPVETEEEEVETEADEKSSQETQETEVTLKIDGVEVKKKLSEVIALAQINGAGDKRLEEAKRLLSEAKALHSSARPENPPAGSTAPPEPKPEGSPRSAAAPAYQPSEADQEALGRYAEAIQVGDKTEAAKALADFSQQLRAQLKSEWDSELDGKIDARVTSTQAHKTTEHEFKSALADFAEKYPQLAKDEDLVSVAPTILMKNLKADMASAGVAQEVIDKYGHSVGALVSVNAVLRQQGYKLRSLSEVVNGVGEYMAKKYLGAVAPASQSSSPRPVAAQRTQIDPAKAQERIDRKRAAPQQPRPSGVRAAVATAPRPKTKAESVAEMRQSRGFPVLK